MLTLKYLLESVGFGLLAASVALLILDYRSGAAFPRWRMAARFAALALIPLLGESVSSWCRREWPACASARSPEPCRARFIPACTWYSR
jgi:hypothetical protein